MNVREAIETIGMQRLAELAGCTRTTIDRTKQRGDFSSSPTGARIRQAIRNEGLPLDGDVVGGEQPDLPIEDALSVRLQRAKIAAQAEIARWRRLKNDEAEGLLLPVDEVQARLGTAATLLRTGVDGARRFRGSLLRRVPYGYSTAQFRRGDGRRRGRCSGRTGGGMMGRLCDECG